MPRSKSTGRSWPSSRSTSRRPSRRWRRPPRKPWTRNTAQLSSIQNPRVQAARRLHRRAGRDRDGALLLEGPVVVSEALDASLPIRDVFLDPDMEEGGDLRARCETAGARVFEVGESVLRAIADTSTPQGVVAVAEMPVFDLSDLPADADLVVCLSQVRDPGNAGTLIRTAAAAGAQAVVFLEGSVDPFAPKTVRASAGAVFRIPILRGAAPEPALGGLRERGFTLVGARGEAEVSLYDADLTGPVVLLLGNEAWGFGDDRRLVFDLEVSIPMGGGVESLNVATAGAILVFEAVRQRRLSSARHG